MEKIKMTEHGQVLNIQAIPGKQYTRADFDELAKEHPEIKTMLKHWDKMGLAMAIQQSIIDEVVESGFHSAMIKEHSGIHSRE